jgi:hypothetical protein
MFQIEQNGKINTAVSSLLTNILSIELLKVSSCEAFELTTNRKISTREPLKIPFF